MDYKKECEKILGKCLDNDIVHGKPHIRRMLEDFHILIKDNRFDKELTQALECAVYLHDIGRKDEKRLKVDHANQSIVILKEDFADFFQRLENKDDIVYAIQNHNKDFFSIVGRENGAITKKEDRLLSLLILLDGMDVIGWSGINRSAQFNKIPLIPYNEDSQKQVKLKRARELLDCPDHRTEEDRKPMQKSSLLEHVAYNYAFVNNVYKRLNNYINDECKEIINQRFKVSKDFCQGLLDLIDKP